MAAFLVVLLAMVTFPYGLSFYFPSLTPINLLLFFLVEVILFLAYSLFHMTIDRNNWHDRLQYHRLQQIQQNVQIIDSQAQAQEEVTTATQRETAHANELARVQRDWQEALDAKDTAHRSALAEALEEQKSKLERHHEANLAEAYSRWSKKSLAASSISEALYMSFELTKVQLSTESPSDLTIRKVDLLYSENKELSRKVGELKNDKLQVELDLEKTKKVAEEIKRGNAHLQSLLEKSSAQYHMNCCHQPLVQFEGTQMCQGESSLRQQMGLAEDRFREVVTERDNLKELGRQVEEERDHLNRLVQEVVKERDAAFEHANALSSTLVAINSTPTNTSAPAVPKPAAQKTSPRLRDTRLLLRFATKYAIEEIGKVFEETHAVVLNKWLHDPQGTRDLAEQRTMAGDCINTFRWIRMHRDDERKLMQETRLESFARSLKTYTERVRAETGEDLSILRRWADDILRIAQRV